MKRLKWNRKLSVLVLIMFITVTFASFNTNLFINGNAYVRVDRDIRITNIHLLETEYNGYENTNSEYTNRTISTDVSLPRQASSLTYEVTITNVSDKRYKITDIIEDSYDNPDVKYELIDASIGNIVEPHTEKTFQIKFTNNTTVVEEDDVYETKTYTFDYTGDVQEFVVPYDGDYKIELWGAQGGSGTQNSIDYPGGYGGYTSGTIHLNKNKTLKVYVGQMGSTRASKGVTSKAFNGGGAGSTSDGYFAAGGGGATDIRIDNGVNSRIMVAGGGGGSAAYTNNNTSAGGAAGGLIAYAGNHTDPTANGKGGTQLKLGASGTRNGNSYEGGGFGSGSSANSNRSSFLHSGGGGSGYYGGGAAGGAGGSGGGGSSFISGHNGCISITSNQSLTPRKDSNNQKCTAESDDITCSYHFSNLIFSNTKIVDGKGYEWTTEVGTEVVGMPTHDGTSTMTGNEGNGYAKITLTRKIENDSEFDFDYTGDEQTFVAPYSGLYRLETWGAQGGKIKHEDIIFDGGYGGYSTGTIKLNKNTILHIYNGGQGDVALGNKAPTATAFNGGGSGYNNNGVRYISGGGGATHIALSSGLLYELENNKNNILIVSGGGGGVWYYPDAHGYYYTKQVGHAGGYVGNTGIGHHAQGGNYEAVGGTQTSGYAFGKGQNATSSEKSGGGGGYYGGMSTTFSGGGGSGYIGNDLLMNKAMYCYNCQESQDINTKTVSTLSHSPKPKQNVAKEGNGFSRITLLKRTINQTKLTLDFTFEEYVNGNEYTFGYTGAPQTFTVPKTGYYKVELWGAQGGTDDDSEPGDGAYTEGKIKLNAGEKLYVYVGGQGITGNHNNVAENVDGGWNGGGYARQSNFQWENPTYYSSGGGATDIRLVNGNWDNTSSLNSRIMVAAGGGGFHHDYHNYPDGVHANIYGGAGGGLVGKDVKFITYVSYSPTNSSSPATQTQGGVAISGITGERSPTRDGAYGMANQYTTESVGAGGGGGYYGGAGCGGGTGGSSYISGHNGSVAITSATDITPRNDSNGNQCSDGTTDITCSKHYSNYIFTDTKMIDGEGYNWTTEVGTEVVGMPTHDGSSTMTGNEGNGFAKITLLEEIPEYTFDHTGDVQEFVAPYKGIYKIQLWGAQGGHYTETYYGGNGGYTEGTITLNKSEKLYLYVGGSGSCGLGEGPYLNGGYNGGGDANFDAGTWEGRHFCSGGGATDIRIVNGDWDNFNSLKSRIMVAGAGGGASYNGAIHHAHGGHGGGLIGTDAQGVNNGNDVTSKSGTQINGFAFGKGATLTCTTNGGGSGYYGGFSNSWAGGAGGSSYISGHSGCVSINSNSTSGSIAFVNDSNSIACNDSTSSGYNSAGYNTDSKCSNHYSGKKFDNTVMIDGAGYSWDANGSSNSVVGMPTHDGRTTMVGNTGNGYAKITLIEKVDTYNINYNLNGGTLSKKKKTYSTFDGDITLGTPTKVGYTFAGWIGGTNLLEIRDTTKTYNGVTFTVNSDKSITMNGTATDPIFYYFNEDRVASSALTISNGNKIPLKSNTNYFLNGKSYSSGTNPNFLIEIAFSNDGSIWYPKGQFCTGTDVSDGIVYMKIKAGAVFENETIYPYLVEINSEDSSNYPTLADATIKRDYTTYDSTPNANRVIPSGSKGHRTYTAVWSKNYNIEYKLDGGSVSGAPNVYAAVSNPVTLPTPTREGYTFMGWTGGKNLLSGTYTNTLIDVSNGSETNDATIYTSEFIEVEHGVSYTVTNDSGASMFVHFYNDQKVQISYDNSQVATKTFVPPANCKYVRVRTRQTENVPYYYPNIKIQLEKGMEATSYEANTTTPNVNFTIPTGSNGNRVYTANWHKTIKVTVISDMHYEKHDSTVYQDLFASYSYIDFDYSPGLTTQEYLDKNADVYVFIGFSWGLTYGSSIKPIINDLFTAGKNIITTGNDNNSYSYPFVTDYVRYEGTATSYKVLDNSVTHNYNDTYTTNNDSRSLIITQGTEVWYKAMYEDVEYDFSGCYTDPTNHNKWVFSQDNFFQSNYMIAEVLDYIVN